MNVNEFMREGSKDERLFVWSMGYTIPELRSQNAPRKLVGHVYGPNGMVTIWEEPSPEHDAPR